MKENTKITIRKAIPKPTFIIRNCYPSLLSYIKREWSYFLEEELEDCVIVIRKQSVFIHISSLYSVILNDLKYMSENPTKYNLEMNAKAKMMLNQCTNF